MEMLNSISLLLGGSWASGMNMYLTMAGLGIAHRFHWLSLPGNLDTLAHPLVIIVALIMYGIEFFADKIPLVDSMRDSFHTIIRPAGGAILGSLAMADAGPAIQFPVALLRRIL